MTKTLTALIERARTVRMTSAQKEEQRRSFAYGNTKIENERITREMVKELAEGKKRRPRR
jgi:hypothetical protein